MFSQQFTRAICHIIFFEHDHYAIESALVLAHKFRDDIRELQPETLVYWQVVFCCD